jgi:hypothetical protein
MLPGKPPAEMPDDQQERHPRWRRYSRKYRNKKRIVRDMWILVGALMIRAPLSVVRPWFLSRFSMKRIDGPGLTNSVSH